MAIFTIAAGVLAAGGFTGALTIAGLSPALSAVVIGVSKGLLWSYAGQALAGNRTGSVSRQEVQANLNQSTGPRVRGYGLFRIGGTRAFFEAKDGTLHQLLVMHHGAIHSIEGWAVDGDKVVLNASGVTTNVAGANYLDGSLQIVALKNAIEGGDYADLRSAFPTLWTGDHKLQGLATFYARMKNPGLSRISKVFPKQGGTLIQADAKLSVVFDPRSNTTGISDNAGLCIRDFMVHPDGYNLPSSDLDEASFKAFSDICDQTLALKQGGTEPRYRLAGHYSFEEARKDVLGRMLDTCDGQVYETGEGKVAILGGQYSEPDFTLTSDDILECDANFGRNPFQDFNVFKGIYTSPDHKFESQECAPRTDSVSIGKYGRRPTEFPVPMCPSDSQMQRLLKTFEARTQPDIRLSLKTSLVGLKARFPKGDGIHTIRITAPELGISGVFEVKSHSYSTVDKICLIDVQSISNAWLWDPVTEQGAAPSPLSELGENVGGDVAPTGLLLSQEVVNITAETRGVIVVAQVNDPNREDLQLIAQIRPTGGVAWSAMNTSLGALRAESNVVSDGVQYEVRVYWAGQTNLPNGEADYPTETITVISNPIAPAAPTALSVSDKGSGAAEISWVNPGSEYDKTRLFRNSTDSFSGASVIVPAKRGSPDVPDSHTDVAGSGTWYYWAAALNASDVSSSPTASVSVTLA